MSVNKKSFEIKHLPMNLEKDHAYKGHLEGVLNDQPFIFASTETSNRDFKYDIPVFPIKEKIKKNELASYVNSLILTPHQKDALAACFLGEIATFPSTKDNRIRLKVLILKQKEHFCDLYELFEPWAIKAPVLHEKSAKLEKRKGRKKRAGVKVSRPRIKRTRVSMYFELYDHPALAYYRNQFFTENLFKKKGKPQKCIPKDIQLILTPRVIAYLFLNRGFFYPASVDETPFWRSYSFRLDHLYYYDQLIPIFFDKYGITLTRELDDSHEVYSYNKKKRFTQFLYVRGESRKKFVDLIKPSLRKEFNNSLYVSKEYLKLVEERQESTNGLDYDYWFPVRARKGRIGKFHSSAAPLGSVKELIDRTDKRERWMANGHKEYPEETFDTQMKTDDDLPSGILPKTYSGNPNYFLGNYGHWPDINVTHSFTPSFISHKTIRDLVDINLHKKGLTVKSSFFKATLEDVIVPRKEKEDKDN